MMDSRTSSYLSMERMESQRQEEISNLRTENYRLKEENKKLTEENDALKKRMKYLEDTIWNWEEGH